ncbi:MAG: winged helix-turn-helix transcriptional regulator [Solirubrobacteraceae bacterium]
MPQVPPPKRHPYDQWSPDARALDLVGDKWTLLIVRDLVAGPRRFVELQRVLPGISTEQLRSRLNRMVADGMLTRRRYREVPPRVDYELTPQARELVPTLGELASWGYRWVWSAPRAGERVEIGAIFRLIPGLVSAGRAEGELELSVSDGHRDGGPLTYTAQLHGDRVELQERSSTRPDAQVSGDTAAWVLALSPAGDRRRLEVSGDHALVESLLSQLSQTTSGAAPNGATRGIA